MKRTVNVSVWLTEAEVRELDQARERALRGLPGARLPRSVYLAELLRRHLAAPTDPAHKDDPA